MNPFKKLFGSKEESPAEKRRNDIKAESNKNGEGTNSKAKPSTPNGQTLRARPATKTSSSPPPPPPQPLDPETQILNDTLQKQNDTCVEDLCCFKEECECKNLSLEQLPANVLKDIWARLRTDLGVEPQESMADRPVTTRHTGGCCDCSQPYINWDCRLSAAERLCGVR